MIAIQCKACLGVGHYSLNGRDQCETCDGDGFIELEGLRADYRSCWLCCGTGYGGVSVRSSCKTCHGTGLCSATYFSMNPTALGNADMFSWIATRLMAEVTPHRR